MHIGVIGSKPSVAVESIKVLGGKMPRLNLTNP